MSEPVRLRVLSYNIRHGQGVGGLLSNRRIAQVVARSGCQLAALTEVWRIPPKFDQPAELSRLTGMQPHFYSLHKRMAIDQGNLMLSSLPVTDAHYMDLGGRRERRGCLLVTTEVGGRPCRVGVVHLSLHKVTRAAQFEQLAADLPLDMPLIVTGDFNCGRGQFGPLADALSWPKDEPATFPSALPFRALDHIGFSDHWRLDSMRVMRSLASDHLPLIAEFSLSH